MEDFADKGISVSCEEVEKEENAVLLEEVREADDPKLEENQSLTTLGSNHETRSEQL